MFFLLEATLNVFLLSVGLSNMTVSLIIGFAFVLYISYRLYQHFFPTPNINPNGKYVLISGCDTGFGHALAIELDKQGFNVLAGVFLPDNVTSLKNKLSPKATVFRLDITKQEDIDAAYDLVKEKTKVLHGLVNNAGVGSGGSIDWISMELMRKVMDVNFFGHVAMTKKFLPLLIAKRDSRVVNICSAAGYLSLASVSAYCASKYAVWNHFLIVFVEKCFHGVYVLVSLNRHLCEHQLMKELKDHFQIFGLHFQVMFKSDGVKNFFKADIAKCKKVYLSNMQKIQ
jgi:NADP-dependent 3-hydroxy acid dehydrogenase YdfG